MDIKELLQTTPEQLAYKQYKELKQHALNKLQIIMLHIKEDRLEEVKGNLCFSPSGDCMGLENYYIGFGNIFSDDYQADIGEIIDRLEYLNKIVESKE